MIPDTSICFLAASLPGPVPLSSTLTSLNPCSLADSEAAAAASPAAYGVDFLVPLYPIAPADDHAIAFPAGSAKVIIVLLCVE